MLAAERREKILRLINKNKIVKVSNLTKKFEVTEETIRRDLEKLEKQGLLKKVYGGAVLPKKSEEPAYKKRKVKHLKEKKAIASKTVDFINDGDAIIIDLGTTTLEVAKLLSEKENLTVFTNSMKIALEINLNNNTVFMLGGKLRKGELSVSGFLTENNLKHFNVDKSIIGVGGVTLDNGITDYHVEESQNRKLMVQLAETAIAVTDHSKFGVKALTHVCDFNDLDILITDDKINKNLVNEINEKNINIILAKS